MWRWLRHVAWPFLYAVYDQFNRHEATVLAGYIAYSAMLAGFPFLLFVTATVGQIIGEDGSETAIDALFKSLPDNVAQTIEPVLLEVVSQRGGNIATLSLLGTIWAASNGIEAIRISLDRAYHVQHPRNIIIRRVRAVFFVFSGFLTFLGLAVLIILAPLMINLIENYSLIRRHVEIDVPIGAGPLRYLVGTALLISFLWVVHRLLPSRNMSGFRLMPGIIVSVLCWGGIASLLSIYLAHAPSYTLTYGALAGVIITLIFLYLTGITIILGAEINSVLNAKRIAETDLDSPDAAVQTGGMFG